jgi:Flp pilus assembly pilin Flp
MFRVLRAFRTEDGGQDLAEYCLLTALVALVAAGIFVHFSGGIQAIWGSANTTLVAGNAVVDSGQSSSTSTASHSTH